MEGFLLVLSHKSSAQVQYCVLENGMLFCYNRPGGALRESICLTRHRVRVHPLSNDNAGVCPNRFAVHALETKRNDQSGAFVSTGKREQKYLFAAATSKTMIQWMDTIHNWRRHAFGDPTHSVHDAITRKELQVHDTKRRIDLLENEQAHLVNMATRFDLKLVSDKTCSGKIKPRGLFIDLSSLEHSISTETKTFRASFASISWLPGFSSLRLDVPGR